jgi:fatty-acyl-CoA synthase
LNYRLLPADWVYMINHSGSRVVCVHADYLALVDDVRHEMPGVEHFVALEGGGAGWLDYETLIAGASPDFTRPEIDENDILSINYTSGTTARPKGVMITHRNAYMNCVGMLIHHSMAGRGGAVPVDAAHVSRERLDVRVDRHGRSAALTCVFAKWTRSPCSSWRVASASRCCAPRRRCSSASQTRPTRRAPAFPRGVRVLTAGAPPAASTIERVEQALGWHVTQLYGLTETSPAITLCEERPEHAALGTSERARIKARQGVELITSGEIRVVDEAGTSVPRDGMTVGEITVRGNVVMEGYYRDPEATARAFHGGWFHSGDAAVVHPDGYVEIRDRLKDVIISGARTSRRSKSKVCCCGIRPCSRWRWLGFRTSSGVKRRTRSSCASPARHSTATSCARSRGRTLPASRCRRA